MAKQEIISRTFTDEEMKALDLHKTGVIALQNEADGIASQIAYHLHAINAGKLWEIESKADGTAYKGMTDYAVDVFGIAKGTCSDAIATFERFGDKEHGIIATKWQEYKFSNLMALKKLSDTDIDVAGITANDSKAVIKSKIQTLENNKAKLAMLPDKRKQAIDLLKEFMAIADGDAIATLDKEMQERFKVASNDIMIDVLEYDTVDKLINVLVRHIDNVKRNSNDDQSDNSDDDQPDNSNEDNSSEVIQDTGNGDDVPVKPYVAHITESMYAKIAKMINKEYGTHMDVKGIAGMEVLLKVCPD